MYVYEADLRRSGRGEWLKGSAGNDMINLFAVVEVKVGISPDPLRRTRRAQKIDESSFKTTPFRNSSCLLSACHNSQRISAKAHLSHTKLG
jgi:hypothetical protein